MLTLITEPVDSLASTAPTASAAWWLVKSLAGTLWQFEISLVIAASIASYLTLLTIVSGLALVVSTLLPVSKLERPLFYSGGTLYPLPTYLIYATILVFLSYKTMCHWDPFKASKFTTKVFQSLLCALSLHHVIILAIYSLGISPITIVWII